jgi:predicted nucleic acid-binding protein
VRLEVLHALSRRARYTEGALASLAAGLDELRFDLLDAEIARVALWVGRGLSAYDASYVALAEREAVPLVTEDGAIVRTAPGIAVALADAPV